MANLDDIPAIKAYVRQRCGLTLQGMLDANLADIVDERVKSTASATRTAYLSQIMKDGSEFGELVVRLTNKETYFFREPRQLYFVVDILIPRMLAQTDDTHPLRILSAGCSSGEEPYSLAIALLEKFGTEAQKRFAIRACDIDHRALDKANRAEYSAFSFRSIDPALKERYFTSSRKNFHTLNDAVRELVDFQQVNLLADAPPLHEQFDIVVFRNVSIYFDEAARRTALRHLHAAMRDGAALIVGSTETLSNDLGVMPLIEEDGYFYFSKRNAAQTVSAAQQQQHQQQEQQKRGDRKTQAKPMRPVMPLAKPVTASPPSRAANALPQASVQDAKAVATFIDGVRELVREKRYAEAMTALAPLRARPSRDLPPLLLEAYILLQRQEFPAAVAMAREALEQDPWSADAAVLLGFACKWQNDAAEAIQWFKRSVYTQYDCWPVHYYLGELYRMTDDADKARHAYRCALQQMNASPDPDGGLLFPLQLPMAEIRFLCNRYGAPSEK